MILSPIFIAEVALSHEGSVGNACALIKLAKENNIDIVKFQDHWARYESTKEEKFRVNIGIDKSRYDYWKRTEFSFDEWKYIYEYAAKINIKLSFSIFSPQSFYRQKKLGNKIWKIGSGELLNEEIINLMLNELDSSDTVILSIGLSDFSNGLFIGKKFAKIVSKVYLLDCISEYPCDIEDYQLENWISNFEKSNNIYFGLSDHSGTIWPTIFSWPCGASLNEFHITFDKKMFGPDQKASLDPNDLKYLDQARDAYNKLIKTTKNNNISNKEEMKKIFGRSIGIINSLKKGHLIKKEDLQMRKPSGGYSYDDIKDIIGKKLIKDVSFDEILRPHHFKYPE